jgi:hypothetical protein
MREGEQAKAAGRERRADRRGDEPARHEGYPNGVAETTGEIVDRLSE